MFNMFKNNNRNTGARREIVFLGNYNANFYARSALLETQYMTQ